MGLAKRIGAPIANVSEYRSCEIKVRFNNMKACLNTIKSLKKQKKYQYKPFTTNAYHCHFCDGWHLGNKPNVPSTNFI